MDIIVKLKVSMNAEQREAWDNTYGTGTDAASIRKDVRAYLLTHCQGSAGIEESGATVSLQA